MADGEGGFWLVSQAACVLDDFLRAGYPASEDVILWDDHARNCRAFYRRSENVIHVVWGSSRAARSSVVE